MIQRSTETRTKGQTLIHKTLSKNMIDERQNPTKIGDELMCSGRENSFCSFSHICRVTLVGHE